MRIDTAFLNDIAHSAGPGSIGSPKTADANSTAGGSLDPVAAGEYDNELLDLHVICGDGRCNENIALQAVHQIFHTEHDRLVDDIKNVLLNDTSGITNLTDWQTALGRGRVGTASVSSRPPASSPRWSTSTWCSRSSPARCSQGSTPSSPSPSTRPTSTRRSPPSSPTRSTASATRC